MKRLPIFLGFVIGVLVSAVFASSNEWEAMRDRPTWILALTMVASPLAYSIGGAVFGSWPARRRNTSFGEYSRWVATCSTALGLSGFAEAIGERSIGPVVMQAAMGLVLGLALAVSLRYFREQE